MEGQFGLWGPPLSTTSLAIVKHYLFYALLSLRMPAMQSVVMGWTAPSIRFSLAARLDDTYGWENSLEVWL